MNQNNASRRTFQKVHRDSKARGTVEASLWRPTDKAQKELAVEAARRYENRHKMKGRRNGPLGYVGLKVYNALWSVVDYSTGRLEPSILWLMEATKCSRDAVVTALKRLQRCGFVDWIRRLEPTGLRGERGPQVRQVTNAYALHCPPDALRLVSPRLGRTRARASAAGDIQLLIDHQRAEIARQAARHVYRDDHHRDPHQGLFGPLLRRMLEIQRDLLEGECESGKPDQSRFRFIEELEGTA